MKTQLLVGALVLLLSTAGTVLAQERGGGFGPPGGFGGGPPGGGFGGRGRGFGGPPPFPLMKALDADGDGTISAKEIANATAALKKLDKNKDGKLTEDELRPEFGRGFGGPGGPGGFGGRGPGGPDPAELIQQLMVNDKNKDGKLSKSELPERMQGLFMRADTNKDGFLTREELTKGMQRGPGGPGGPPPGF